MATYADTPEPSRGHSSKLHILYIFHRIIQMRLLYAGIMQSENTVTNIHIDSIMWKMSQRTKCGCNIFWNRPKRVRIMSKAMLGAWIFQNVMELFIDQLKRGRLILFLLATFDTILLNITIGHSSLSTYLF